MIEAWQNRNGDFLLIDRDNKESVFIQGPDNTISLENELNEVVYSPFLIYEPGGRDNEIRRIQQQILSNYFPGDKSEEVNLADYQREDW